MSCYPGALCNVTYEIPAACSEVWEGLERQMKEWDNSTGPRCPGDCDQRHFLETQRGPPLVPVQLEGTGENCTKCPCGQQCLYVHTHTSRTELKGSHITPVIRYVDDIIFEKLQDDDNYCKLKGHSFSTGPAYFDFTTNYCNMRNLMVGAGYTELSGYRETSSVDLCMQYDRIQDLGNCNKY